MSNRWVKGFGLAVLFSFITGSLWMSNALAADKMAYVDLAKVFDNYNKTKSFDKDLAAQGEKKRVEREKMVADVKKLRDSMEMLSDKGKEEKQGEIDQKVTALQDFDRNTRDQLRRDRDRMVQAILKEIDDVIQDYGKNQGYNLILNDRVLLFKTESMDISDEIIKALNAKYKG